MALPGTIGPSRQDIERIVEKMLLENFGVLHHHRIAGQVPTDKIEDQAIVAGKLGALGLGTHFGDRYVSSPTSVAIGTANRANYCEVWIPHRTTLTGIRYRVGGTSSGNVRGGLYNPAGTNIAESATIAQAAANQVQDLAFASTVAVSPGLHYMAIIFSSSTATRTTVNGIVPSSEVTEGAFDLPGSITVPTAQSALTTLMSTY